jgi:hypothetical protein
MGLDIRLPMGLLFTLLGLLIGGCGLRSDGVDDAYLFGINVNLAWGVLLLAFGAGALLLSWSARRRLLASRRL